jgi:hypothetical protein
VIVAVILVAIVGRFMASRAPATAP